MVLILVQINNNHSEYLKLSGRLTLYDQMYIVVESFPKSYLSLCRHWFKPLGLYLGIKPSNHKKPPTNEVLEQEFQAMRKDKKFVSDKVLLSAKLGMTERQVDYWLKQRKLYGK